MTKKFSQFLLFTTLLIFAVIVSSCSPAASTNTPSSEYTHYTPSEFFHFNLEFDYPSYWLLYEDKGYSSVYLNDPKLLTLPTPGPSSFHPTPNDLGSISISRLPIKSNQTLETELELYKQNNSNSNLVTMINEHKTKINGNDVGVLEYQINDQEIFTSLMFGKNLFFMVNDQVYMIDFIVVEKDRGGEFEKGFDYFLSSIKIIP